LENKFLKYSSDLEEQIKDNEKQKETLLKAQEVARIGDWQYHIGTDTAIWSSEMLKILGITDTNIKYGAKYIRTIMHPDDIDSVLKSIHNCAQNKTDHDVTYRVYHPDGKLKWINSRGRYDHKTNSILGTIQDITQTKELELEKQEQDKILLSQSRSAAMGEMISMIAHQWRQPLTIISMHANNVLLQIELEAFDVNEAKKSAHSILLQTNHLSQTINDFRDFFKPNKEKNKESIVKVIDDSIGFMVKILDDNKIECKIDYDKKEKIIMYQRELIQVFLNIIKNASEALIENKNESRKINIEVKHNQTYTKVNIYNNGGYIKDENLSKIFEPYFSTKDNSNGTGLGLYICKLIIEKHMHGKLTVRNVDEGVCFSIEIPQVID